MLINFVELLTILFILFGSSVCQSKSDSIRNGIIMNSANETEDSGNTTLADGTIDKNAIKQPSVDDVIRPINSSDEQLQIEPRSKNLFEQHLSQYLVEHPGAKVIKPTMKDDMNELQTIKLNGTKRVEVILHLLDINKYLNYLQINYTLAESKTTTSINFIEFIEPPNVKRVVSNDIQEFSVFLKFDKSEANHYRGYLLTYEIMETNVHQPVSASEPQEKLNLLIEVPQPLQVNETWNLFRVWLANSTNKYIHATNMDAEKCSEDNVTFVNIAGCKTAWPNAQKCVKVDFSIRLKSLASSTENSRNKINTKPGTPGTTEMHDSNGNFEMTRQELINMWIRFGREEFNENGFKEFPVPDAQKLLLVWTSVSLAIVCAFLMVLAAIWKMDVLRDYRRMYWKSNADDEKQICKSSNISMYPPVHQTVPTLFPNDLSAPSNTNASPFEYINRPIMHSIDDFKRRPSLEESLKPSENVKRKAGEVPFRCDTEFNEQD